MYDVMGNYLAIFCFTQVPIFHIQQYNFNPQQYFFAIILYRPCLYLNNIT